MSDREKALEALYWLAREARPEATQRDVNDAVALILAALEQQRVPEGWKLVPVPTREMLWEGFPLLSDEDA